MENPQPPPIPPTSESNLVVHPQRLAVAICAGVGTVSVFLPWIADAFDSFNGISLPGGFGWVAAVAYAGCIVAVMAGGNLRETMGQIVGRVVPLLAVAGSAVGIFHLAKTLRQFEGIVELRHVGIGLWLTIVSGALAVLLSYVLGKKK